MNNPVHRAFVAVPMLLGFAYSYSRRATMTLRFEHIIICTGNDVNQAEFQTAMALLGRENSVEPPYASDLVQSQPTEIDI